MNNSLKKYDIKIAVLLLNWNGIEFTLPCIQSLLRGSIKPTSIMVVDNASIDDSVSILKNTFPDVEIIQNQSNLGFAGGNNVGFQKLLLEDYDYIWVLNNDTTVDKCCLKNLLEEMEGDISIAAASGKILYDEPQNLIWYAGAKINHLTLKSSHVGLLQLDTAQYDSSTDVPFISGCCMFMRISTLKDVGIFDNNFFAYSEDFDWCLRAGYLGLRLRYVPSATLRHKVSATFNKTRLRRSGGTSSPLAIYLATRNRMYIIRKHAKSGTQFLTAFLIYLVWNIYYGSVLLMLLRIDKLKSLIKGMWHGILTKLIKVENDSRNTLSS